MAIANFFSNLPKDTNYTIIFILSIFLLLCFIAIRYLILFLICKFVISRGVEEGITRYVSFHKNVDKNQE